MAQKTNLHLPGDELTLALLQNLGKNASGCTKGRNGLQWATGTVSKADESGCNPRRGLQGQRGVTGMAEILFHERKAGHTKRKS